MPVEISLHFDSPQAIYHSGETVSGHVTLVLDKPKKIRCIALKIKGKAKVEWTERKRQGKKTNHKTYSAKEKYLEDTHNCLGGETGEIDLDPGEYTYPFRWQLPHSLPSSFEGTYGQIRYTVKANLHRPWRFNSVAKSAFTVIEPLDLNLHAEAKEPVMIENCKYFCCLWCQSGPLTVTVTLPAGGYVPGQTIQCTLNVSNDSTTPVEGFKCVLSKEVLWHASHFGSTKTRSTSYNVAECKEDEGVNAHESKEVSINLIVPSVPPSNLENCSIIDLEYILKVKLIVGGIFHTNLKVRVPILMGTIPLLTGPTAFKLRVPHLPSAPSLPQQPIGWQPAAFDGSTPSAPPYPQDLPPPSYEECVLKGNSIRGSKDNQYTMGIQDFTPRYPVWSFDSVLKN